MRRGLAAIAFGTVLILAACSDAEEAPPTNDSPSRAAPTASDALSPTGPVRVRLVEVATLEQPLGMAVRRGDGSLYFAQKTGRVVALRDGGSEPEVVLDLSGAVSQGGEQGLLGIAFSPDGDHLYTNHTDPGGDTRITEWRIRGGEADPGSRRELLVVEQPFSNHNGGNIAFGPDGYLYIGLGDGGSGGDPMGNAQSLDTLLGKMLRIDPEAGNGEAYSIPSDNPLRDRSGARPEIWAFGLRNPWRFSFDRDTGDLWIADVGQGSREEISFQPADSNGGENYGWDRLEGTLPFEGDAPEDAVAPVHEYGRDRGATIIGGYVYRGSDIPALQGAYLFGDFFTPQLRILRTEGGEAKVRDLGVSVDNLAAFGEDLNGELYAISLGGTVFRIASRSG